MNEELKKNDSSDDVRPSAEMTQGTPAQPSVFPAQQGVPPQMMGTTFGISMTNSSVEAELVKKVNADIIQAELQNRHHREMKKLELQEKELALEDSEQRRAHDRHLRECTELEKADGRGERIFYVVLAAIAAFVIALVATSQTEKAMAVLKEALSSAGLVGAGGGLVFWRQHRKAKRKPPPSDE